MSDIEPFAEKWRSAENHLGTAQYRVGYRLSTNQAVLAHVEIPAEAVERAVLTELSIAPRISSDGRVTADVLIKNDVASRAHVDVTTTPIDQLVIRVTASETLRVEETQASELRVLLDLLERSVSAVRAALATFAERT